MNFAYYGKKSIYNLDRKKDFAVLFGCLILYIAFFVLIATPFGATLYKGAKESFPFIGILEMVVDDAQKLLGLIFGKTLGQAQETAASFYAKITISGVFLDFVKILVGVVFCRLFFKLFSLLFLHAKENSMVDILIGGEKTDFLYFLNKTLLYGIAGFLGVFLANIIIQAVSTPIRALDSELSFFISFMVFIAAYILFAILLVFESKKSVGGAITFRQSIKATTIFHLVPDMITNFIKNAAIIIAFNILTNYPWTFFIILPVTVIWLILEDLLSNLLSKLYNINFLCGKYCPISGIAWLPANISLYAMIYVMAVPTYLMSSSRETDALIDALISIPFIGEWMQGLPVFDMVSADIGAYIEPLLILFVLCNFIAWLQYLSSSFTATMFTQIILRLLVLLGVAALLILFAHMFLTMVCVPAVYSIQYTGVATIMFVVLYLIFAYLQPYVAFQGIAMTVITLILLQHFPGTVLANFVNGDMNELGYYMFSALGVISFNIIVSLVQNIIAMVEKFIWKKI